MANGVWSFITAMLIFGAFPVFSVGVATASEGGPTRVRSDSPTIRTALLEGARRSVTFRQLIETIEGTDGIVFVQEGRCGHGARACLALTVTLAGPNRLLRVVVDVRRADWDLMGSLGHELQHALEVLNDRAVKRDEDMFFLYKRIGQSSGSRFETEAAILAGDSVRREARRDDGAATR
jgi:hypothetical protein